jgi:hypothetical protein
VILHTDSEPPRVFYPPMSIASHAKWGYWETFEGDPAPILEMAARAARIDPSPLLGRDGAG